MAIATEIFKPSAIVGAFYARVRNTAMPFVEVGNWTEAAFEQQTEEDRTPDMRVLGGGTHAKLVRIKSIVLKAKTADLNLTTLARHLRGVVATTAAGNVTDQVMTIYAGGLTPLQHLNVSAVSIKKADGTAVAAAGNYEVRPEGIFALAGSTAIAANLEGAKVSYTYGEQVSLDALAAADVELELMFAGLNEANSGKPEVIEVFRTSPDLLKKLPLLSSKLMELDLEFELLTDPTKTGAGTSRWYRKRYA